MKKKCYFCSTYQNPIVPDVWCSNEKCENFSEFVPTTDWIEYERLKIIESVMSEMNPLGRMNIFMSLIDALIATNYSFENIKKENEDLKHKLDYCEGRRELKVSFPTEVNK